MPPNENAIAEWLYGRILDERECWAPETYPAHARLPWNMLDRQTQDWWRTEAQGLIELLA